MLPFGLVLNMQCKRSGHDTLPVGDLLHKLAAATCEQPATLYTQCVLQNRLVSPLTLLMLTIDGTGDVQWDARRDCSAKTAQSHAVLQGKG